MKCILVGTLLFVAMLYLESCSSATGELLITPCEQTVPNTDLNSFAANIEKRLAAITSVSRDLELDTYEEFLVGNFGEDGGSELNEIMTDELESYAALGYDAYLSDKVSQGLISSYFGDYLVEFYTDLSQWMESNEPNESELDTYLGQSSVEVDAIPGLCAFEKYQAILYHESILGWYRFMEPMSSYSSFNEITTRSCNWWQAIICGTGGIIVGIVTGGGTYLILSGSQEVEFGGTPIPPGQAREDFATATGISVAIYAGISFYNWCCRLFELGECDEPMDDLYVTALDCNDYYLHIVSSSGGAITYEWDNVNMDPSTAITTYGTLRVEAVNPSLESSTSVRVTCIDPKGAYIYELGPYEVFLSEFSEIPPPAPTWGWAPPTTAIVNSTYSIAVSIPGFEYYDLSWSTQFGASITSTGTFTADVTFYSQGTTSVTATITNVCTGQYAQLTGFVTVNPN